MPNDPVVCRSTGTTVSKLAAWLTGHERENIARFIQERFRERYFAPIEAIRPAQKDGFLIMGVSCLTLESIEAFRKGWPSTERHSREAFEGFLRREPRFTLFRSHEGRFYENVRCGILHRAETLGGWRIRRSGPLFDAASLTINATDFHRQLEGALFDYVGELRNSDFRSPVWKKARRRLSNLVTNCEVPK
ncbi:MAG TPA: hypothetical protein VGT04_00450 [Acidobacteriaceae bacterium]|nr:hypothetical protein [Acidobacteriaceae bacterium]